MDYKVGLIENGKLNLILQSSNFVLDAKVYGNNVIWLENHNQTGGYLFKVHFKDLSTGKQKIILD